MEYYQNLDLNDIVYFCDYDFIWKTEQWKPIKDYEGIYEVSDLGRVKSLNFHREKRAMILKQELTKLGYLRVSLFKNSKNNRVLSHRLVLYSFIPNPENKPQVNHKNSIKINNSVKNLEWNTRQENITHSYLKGTHVGQKGEKRYNSKLTDEKVLEIRKIGNSKTLMELAKEYNVSFQLISSIINRKTWNHI